MMTLDNALQAQADDMCPPMPPIPRMCWRKGAQDFARVAAYVIPMVLVVFVIFA